MSGRTAPRIAWATCAFSLALTGMGLALHVLNRAAPSVDRNGWWASASAAAVGFALTGALVAAHRRANPIGWIFLAMAVSGAVDLVALEYGIYALGTNPGSIGGGAVSLWVASWVWSLSALMLLIFLLFPDGHLLSRRWRPVLALSIALPVLYIVGRSLDPGAMAEPKAHSFPNVDNPFGIQGAEDLLQVLGVAVVPLVFATVLAAVASLFVRFRRAVGDERQQLKWLVYGGAFMAVQFIVGPLVDLSAWQIVNPIVIVLFLAALAFALLRYRLYDIDLVINRTLVYSALTAGVVGAYVGMVAFLGALLQHRAGLVVSLLATGLVALLFAPLRLRLQRAVDRLLYGQRSEPYELISRLGARLEETPGPEQVLPTLVETVARALKLQYAAIELRHGERLETAATFGRRAGEPLRFPLVYQGTPVGRLLLGPRRPGEPFSRGELRLFEDIARQAGIAAYAVRLSADLQRSRERLVGAREEERRRLRRDLHDGLGPQLAGVSLQLDVARKLTRSDPPAAEALLEGLALETQSAIADIRRLVYELRPPALDELGLAGALRQQALRFARGASRQALTVVVDTLDELDGLPAAVEVAAYRIALEALTNVARHADARTCTVRIVRDGALVLEVLDDGKGLPQQYSTGIGLASIRERVAELGGTCMVGPGPSGGTLVRARLPLAEA